MTELSSDDFRAYAEERLNEAGERYRRAVRQPYNEARGELARIASLTWDATIDVLFALALPDGRKATGRSGDMSNYAKYEMPDVYTYWSGGPARLHNFQHKPDSSEYELRRACHYTGVVLDLLNNRLPTHSRLPSSAWEWLLTN